MGSMMNSSSSATSSNQEWNPEESLTAALPESIGVTKFQPGQKLDIGGPSKSVQVLLYMKGKGVLMAEDWDYRKTRSGDFRITFKALKASFGFGLRGDESVYDIFEVIKGQSNPPNRSLYGQLEQFFDNLTPLNFVYSERGDGWGPAVTAPVEVEYSEDLASKIVEAFNEGNSKAISENGEEHASTRYRNFRWVPLSVLEGTGNDDPAVLDGSKLVSVELDGETLNLWDENQMRKNVVPLLRRE